MLSPEFSEGLRDKKVGFDLITTLSSSYAQYLCSLGKSLPQDTETKTNTDAKRD